MIFKSPLFVVGVFFVAEEQAIICCAFGWQASQNTDSHATNSRSQDSLSYERPNRLLQALTSLAQNGATVWSNHISDESGAKLRRESRLKETSSFYEPPTRMQRSREDQEQNIDSVGKFFNEDSYQVKSSWPDHFFEEALALIFGGAAANRYSLFTTVVAGTIFATVIVTIGAITSALLFDESDEDFDNYYWRKDNFKTVPTTTAESKGCDLEDGVFEETPLSRASSDQSTFNDSTLQELKKCFAGKPSSEFMFTAPPSQMCSRDLPQYESSGFGVDHDTVHEDNIVNRQANNHQLNAEGDEVKQQKVVQLIWHDSHSATVNQYYTGNTNHQGPKRIIQKVSGQSFDLEDTEREGAMLLSNSFRVTSLAFGLLGDAVRFAGESTAATAGASARLVGGAVKAGGWAVGSLGSTLSADKSSDGNNDRSERRQGTRHVAGASVKLLGDAIDNVAESFLLAGSATERIAFAATGAAEGVVRVVEDFTSTLSKVFAKEGEKAGVSGKPSQIVADISASEKSVKMVKLDDPSHQNELVNDVDDQSQYIYHDDTAGENSETSDHLIFLSLANIMQDTAGVSSTSPRVLFVLVILYFASLVLLKDRNSSDDIEQIAVQSNGINLTESKNKRAIPHGITADEADTHSTLTIDSTMKRGPDFSFTSRGAKHTIRCVLWTTMLPFRLSCVILVHAYRLIFSKKTALLVLHILAWFFICQVSQNRAAVIERKSMLAGYKNAVESIGSSFVNDRGESAFWLNSIISRVWRVRAHDGSDIGGMEPLLASSVSSLLARRLEETYSRPSGVAHVSLESLTFGPSPPFVRDVIIKGADVKEAKVYLTIDVIMLLEDAALMLGMCTLLFSLGCSLNSDSHM